MSVIKAMNKKSSVCRYFLGLVMVLPLSVGHCAGTGQGQLDVSAEIAVGSCDVLLRTSDGGAASAKAEVSINAVDRINMQKGGMVSFGENYVDVSLKCAALGVNSNDGVPTITINGTPMASDPSIFARDSGSMDSRVGVVISTVPHAPYTAIPWNDSEYIKPKGQDKLTNFKGLDGSAVTRRYYVGLSCGSTPAECSQPNGGDLTTGDISVAMSLTFAYQ